MAARTRWQELRQRLDADPRHKEEIARLDEERRLLMYVEAVEAIIRAVPGKPMVNGVALSPDAALDALRHRFGIDADRIAALRVARENAK